MISRKKFLRAATFGALGGAAALSGCGPVDEPTAGEAYEFEPQYTWLMVTTWPPGFPILGEGAERFAKLLTRLSGGRIRVKVFGANELVPAFEVFDAVGSGAAQLGTGAAYYWAGKTAAAQFFSGVPFGMNAQQFAAWIYSGGGQELWEEVYAPFNVQPFLGGNTGIQMGGWFNKPIERIEDYRGLKMRIPGLGGKVVERAGGTPVLLPASELYTSLEQGVIDATEWIGPYHDYKMGFADITDYYYAPGWHEPGSALELIIDKAVYDRLPPDLKAIVRVAAAELNGWTLAEFEAKNQLFLQKIIEEGKVELRRFPDPVLDALRRLAEGAIGEIAADDDTSKNVYTHYRAFQKRVAAWSEITEKAFYNSLQATLR